MSHWIKNTQLAVSVYVSPETDINWACYKWNKFKHKYNDHPLLTGGRCSEVVVNTSLTVFIKVNI